VNIDKKSLKKIILKELYDLHSQVGEEESVFKERELSHEINRCLGEISFLVDAISKKSEYPTDMDTVEVSMGQLKKWKDTLTKFLMAIGG
jgi:hypothetical protein